MFAVCRADNTWFQKCAEGDLDYVKSHMKNVERRDPRQSSETIFPHFTGLMYAAFYGRIEVFKHLFEYEVNLNTIEQTVIECQFLKTKYVLASDSSITFIAIAREQEEILGYIMKKQALIGKTNNIGQNATLFAVSINSQVGLDWVFESLVFKKEATVTSCDGMNVFSNCCYFGRTRYMEAFAQVVKEPERFENLEVSREEVMTVRIILLDFLASVDQDGQTLRQLAQEEVNYKKVGTSKEDKEAVLAMVVEMEGIEKIQ